MKTLHISGIHKLEGMEFWDGRFVCTNTVENSTNYRFQFIDNHAVSRFVWVEVSRFGKWDSADQKWFYTLNYPNAGTHMVSVDWFSDWGNVIKTFGEALKVCR